MHHACAGRLRAGRRHLHQRGLPVASLLSLSGTFFSGLYPSQHGVWNNVEVGNALSRGLSEGVKLWSEDLQENGYRLFFSGSGDTIVNPYIMTALAPYGPGLVLEEGDGAAPGHPVP